MKVHRRQRLADNAVLMQLAELREVHAVVVVSTVTVQGSCLCHTTSCHTTTLEGLLSG